MHCATLDIKAKVEYTLVPFMLSFCCPAGFWLYLPSISRSNVLLLIFLYTHTFCVVLRVLCDPVASANMASPGIFRIYRGGWGYMLLLQQG